MSIERRLKSVEDRAGITGTASASAEWVSLHRLDMHALLRGHLEPGTVAKIRAAYHVPEGTALDFIGWEGGDIPATHWAEPSWRDAGSGQHHPVDAPVIERIDLPVEDQKRLPWLRWRCVLGKATGGGTPCVHRWEDDRFLSAFHNAEEMDGLPWFFLVVQWMDRVPRMDLSTPPDRSPQEAIPPVPTPPRGTWEDVAEHVRDRRTHLNPRAKGFSNQRGTPEEADALSAAEWTARHAQAAEQFLE